MKRIFAWIPVLLVMFLFASCKDKDSNGTPVPMEKEKILVTYPWKLKEITDLAGKSVPADKWDITARMLPSMNFEFQAGNKVFARGIGDSQVVNGGTWFLKEDGKVVDIDISGFKGTFGLAELSVSKMKLTRKMPISGVEQETVMVFDPVIK